MFSAATGVPRVLVVPELIALRPDIIGLAVLPTVARRVFGEAFWKMNGWN